MLVWKRRKARRLELVSLRRQAVAAAADLNTRRCRLASFFAHAARHKGGASFFGVALDFQEVGDP